MPKDRFTMSPYHQLPLTLKDQRMLLEIENDLVEDTFRKYEEYVLSNSQVNPARWKFIKSKDDLNIYAKRAKASHCCKPDKRDGPVKPIVLSVGSFKGQLDDLMFGTVNPTDAIMQLKASYVHDYSDGAVLATLIKPTASDPFRSVTVKWLQIDLPLSRTKLIKDRDFLCLEGSGVLHFANGERVGYLMLHSIESPLVQPLPTVIRAKHNITGFFRQIAPNVIDTFAFDSVDPGGCIPEAVLLPICANALLSATNYVKCGLMKKLTWMLRQRQEALFEANIAPVPRNEDVCVTCNCNLQSGCLNSFGRGMCRMCLGGLCFSCKVVKTLNFLSPEREIVRDKITFCEACVTMAFRMSSMDAARDQANGYQPYYTA
ncbi:START-like domain [Plasmopara halstedii]|uniref:START-like domain n=1 Tax=Plasmopara halstedii TaxID=4781 RepID=A0A0P1B7B4_PLAHL|nr:START-like domain [Plasmopara halstedii]CEG49597.1 START-like domain [Plasmopara halstedii]|eukprot:XP_024585966.1 START-like domain [Plasmopara halstedii]